MENKFTNTELKRLKPHPEKRLTVHDPATRGLQLRITPNGVKTFYLLVRPPGGKLKRVNLGRLGDIDVKQARTKADRLRPQLRDGALTPQEQRREAKKQEKQLAAQKATVREVMESYIAYKTHPSRKRPMRQATQDFYWNTVNAVIPDRLDDPLLDIDVKTALEIVTNYPKSTGQGCLKALRALFNYWLDLHERDLAHLKNPISNKLVTEHLKPAPARTGRLTDDELKPWWGAVMKLPSLAEKETAQYEDARDLLCFLLLTGIRIGNARSLAWDSVNLKARTFTIEAEDAKNHERIELPLCDHLVTMLKGRNQYSDLVFGDVDLRWARRRIAQEVKFDRKPHDLRRTYAGILERMDVSETAKKRLLGHTLGDITDVYANTQAVTEPMRKGNTKATNHILKKVGLLKNVKTLEAVA